VDKKGQKPAITAYLAEPKQLKRQNEQPAAKLHFISNVVRTERDYASKVSR